MLEETSSPNVELLSKCRGLFELTSGIRIVGCGEEEAEGVQVRYLILRRSGRRSILILCPVCGRWGRLNVRERTAYGRRFKVLHGKTKSGCSLSYATKGFEAVVRIYNIAKTVP